MQRLKIVIVITLAALIALPVFVVNEVHAGQIGDRRFLLDSNAPGAVTKHTASFNIPSSANVGSIMFEYCIEDPFVGRPCTSPSNMDVTGMTLGDQTGETGFSVDVSTSVNRILLTRLPAVTTTSALSYEFENVLNPDITGSYYIRVATYSSDDGTGSVVDEGGMAIAIEDQFTIGTYVPPFLLFCVGVTVQRDCSSTNGSFISMGELSESRASSATTQMSGATNGQFGMTVAVAGTTMTSGNNIIPQLSSATGSIPGVSQFGLNLRANSNPVVGINPDGPGTASPRPGYGTVNQFRFNPGDTIYSTNTTTDFQRFTVSYLVNVSDDQPVGYYVTTLSYVAFASF